MPVHDPSETDTAEHRPIGDDAEVVEVGQPPLSSLLGRIDFGKVSDRGKKRSNNEDKLPGSSPAAALSSPC